VSLTPKQRAEVRRKFEDSPVKLAGLGSAFEYHSNDPEELRRNVEGTKEYARLAADVGAPGIKVRPNGLKVKEGVPEDATLRQIAGALVECGEYAARLGVQVRLEVHGHDTCDPRRIAKIMNYCGHPNVYVCWNSNENDLIDGSLDTAWNLLSGRIGLVHVRDLAAPGYSWLELIRRLRSIGYEGYCLNEIEESDQPARVMQFNRALFDAYNRIVALEASR
jgi:sugar phosphate isomerase/epimerase